MLPMVIEEINLQKCCSQINIIFSERQFLHKFEKSMNLIPLFFFNLSKVNISSVQFTQSCLTLRDPMNRSTPGLPVHHQLPEVTDSRPSSQWCHPTISSSVIPFSSCPQSLPASESFPMSQLFAWGGQSTGISASASFLPKKSQGWSPSEWTGWISLQSKGPSRVFSNTTVQNHQFFGTQPSSQSTLTSIHDHRKNHSLD